MSNPTIPAGLLGKFIRIRLALHGCANRPFYHIVAIHHQQARNGRVFEQLGTFDPIPNLHNEKLISMNFDRLQYWLSVGALPTRGTAKLLGLSGFLPVHPMSYIEAKRNLEYDQRMLETKKDQTEDEANS